MVVVFLCFAQFSQTVNFALRGPHLGFKLRFKSLLLVAFRQSSRFWLPGKTDFSNGLWKVVETPSGWCDVIRGPKGEMV